MEHELTVQQASKELGIKLGTVRKAFRHGHLWGRRLGDAATWSVLLLDPASVQHYREAHLGKPGASGRCPECDARRELKGGATS